MDVQIREGDPRHLFPRQAGLSMLEVVISAAILIVVLVPATSLLSSSAGFVTEAKAQAQAAHLASGLLEQDRASAVSSSYWSGSTPGLVDTTAANQTVGNLKFSVSQAGGWCVESGSSTWTNYASLGTAVAGYKVKAKVTWQAGTQSVVLTTLLTTPSSVTAPASSASCPT